MRKHATPFLIGITAIVLSGIALAQAASESQPKATHEPAHHATHIAACAVECETCSHHCSKMVAEGKKDHAATQWLCQDCAAICQAASAISARQGPLADAILPACADACRRCSEACAKMPDDKMMAHCADVCRKCETMCREMIQRGFSK